MVVVRGLPPVVAALQVVWLLLAGKASDGFLVFLCRYVCSRVTQLFKSEGRFKATSLLVLKNLD